MPKAQIGFRELRWEGEWSDNKDVRQRDEGGLGRGSKGKGLEEKLGFSKPSSKVSGEKVDASDSESTQRVGRESRMIYWTGLGRMCFLVIRPQHVRLKERAHDGHRNNSIDSSESVFRRLCSRTHQSNDCSRSFSCHCVNNKSRFWILH